MTANRSRIPRQPGRRCVSSSGWILSCHGILLLFAVIRVPQVHRPLQASSVPSCCGLCLLCQGHPLPPDAPIWWFKYVTQIVLTLDNQKNSIPGETVSHSRSECPDACPVRVGVNIFLRQREHGCDLTTIVSNYPTPQGLHSVISSIIITVLWTECKQVGAARLGFTPDYVGGHYICSGGAMDMCIANFPDRTLMAIRRWRSLGFMVYIQQQISFFRTGVLVCMGAQPWFRHL